MKKLISVLLVLALVISMGAVFADESKTSTWIRFGKSTGGGDNVSMAQLAIDGPNQSISHLGNGYSDVVVNLKAFYLEKMGFQGIGWVESIKYKLPGESNEREFFVTSYTDPSTGLTYTPDQVSLIDEDFTANITLRVRTTEANAALAAMESIRWGAKIKSRVRFTSGNTMSMPSNVKMSLTGVGEPVYQ